MATVIDPSPLRRLVNQFEERNCIPFQPKRAFFVRLGIGQKRFGQLLRGEVPPTTTEVKALSDFFQVPQTDFLELAEAA